MAVSGVFMPAIPLHEQQLLFSRPDRPLCEEFLPMQTVRG